MDVELLKEAIKNNAVTDYLRGTRGYRVQGMNGDPGNVLIQDYTRVLLSFQNFYKSNKDPKIIQILYSNIEKLLASVNEFDIYTALNIIVTQIWVEDSSFCVFKITDLEKLLQKLKESLIKNKVQLSKIRFNKEEKSVWELANSYNQHYASRGKATFL